MAETLTLRGIRLRAGLTLRQAAARAGFDFTILSDLERQQLEPAGTRPRRRLARYADALAQAYGLQREELLRAAGVLQFDLPMEREADDFEKWLAARARMPVTLPADLRHLVPYRVEGGFLLLEPGAVTMPT